MLRADRDGSGPLNNFRTGVFHRDTCVHVMFGSSWRASLGTPGRLRNWKTCTKVWVGAGNARGNPHDARRCQTARMRACRPRARARAELCACLDRTAHHAPSASAAPARRPSPPDACHPPFGQGPPSHSWQQCAPYDRSGMASMTIKMHSQMADRALPPITLVLSPLLRPCTSPWAVSRHNGRASCLAV